MQTGTSGFATNIDANGRRFNAKVDIYFDGDASAATTLYSGSIINFSILEDFGVENNLPYGITSSNELTLNLRNNDDEFTPTNTSSTYYGKMLTGIKVVLYLGLYVSSSYEYIKLFTGRIQDWDVDSIQASIKCCDDMYEILNLPCPYIRARLDLTFAEAFELLFDELGLDVADYNVATTLTDTIGYTWFEGDTAKDVVKQLSMACRAAVTMDRDGVIQVIDTTAATSTVKTITDSNQIFESKVLQDYNNIYNKVRVALNVISLIKGEVLSLLEQTIAASSTNSYSSLAFTDGPVFCLNKIDTKNDSGYLENEEYSTHEISFDLVNNVAAESIFDTVVNAVLMDITKYEVNDTSLTLLPTKDSIFSIDNMYIQDATQAAALAAGVLAIVEQVNAFAWGEIRHDPRLELWDRITMTNTSDSMGSIDGNIIRNTLEFSGGLRGEVTIIKNSLV